MLKRTKVKRETQKKEQSIGAGVGSKGKRNEEDWEPEERRMRGRKEVKRRAFSEREMQNQSENGGKKDRD
jgi:hypothetical protein